MTREKFERLYPRLAAHLLARTIFFDYRGQYVGRAADGKEVLIGNVHGEEAVESYLRSNPTPGDW